MANGIRVSLTPETLHAPLDGSPVEAVIAMQNTGTDVDQYAVELDGLPSTWYSLVNPAVAMFPQDKEEARLIVRPPKGGSVTAGAYPFRVAVVSRKDNAETSRVEGVLRIGAVSVFDLEVAPRKVIATWWGRFNIVLRNSGNVDLDLALEGSDPEDACRYTFRPESPLLSAGERITVRARVRRRGLHQVGYRKQFDVKFAAQPSTGQSRTVHAQYIHTPLFRTWRPVRRWLLLFLLLFLLLLYLTVPPVNRYVRAEASTIRGAVCVYVSIVCLRHIHITLPHPKHTTVTTFAVDDGVQGTDLYQFNYVPARDWQHCLTPPIGHDCHPSYYEGTNSASDVPLTYATIAFTGTAVAYYATRGSNRGFAAVSIDGGSESIVNLYGPAPQYHPRPGDHHSPLVTQRGDLPLYQRSGLTSGVHTLKIRVTGSKDMNSTGTFVTVDRVDITLPPTRS